MKAAPTLNILTCALLFILDVFTHAAPLLNPHSTSQLDLVDITNTTALSHSTTHLSINSPFTPGRQPSQDPIYYDVPDTDPPLNIKFRDYRFVPNRDDRTDVERVFREAMAACGEVQKHDVEMEDELHVWASGRVQLVVEPYVKLPDEHPPLTYGIFAETLRGLNAFRLFYPHLDFNYEIFLHPNDPRLEYYLGKGTLSVY